MYLLGIVIFLLGISSAAVLKGFPVQILWNPAAIILHLTSIVAVLTATNGFSAFWHGLKAAILPNADISDDMRGRAASLFRLLSKTAILVSLLGLFIAVMSMLAQLDDASMVGHTLANALLMPLYGLFLIAAVFEPAVVVLKKRQSPERRIKQKD